MDRGIDLSKAGTGYDPQLATNYILAIGIDAYKHWDPLQNAVKDASDFVKVLTQQYQFEKENVVALLDDAATEDQIRDKIKELKRRVTPRDNLIVYYSGHGHYDTDFEEGYWVPVDARRDSGGRYISNADIITWINRIEAQHILLIIDSCFSGSLVIKKRSTMLDEQYRSRRIISSGRVEAVSDGLPGRNSPFAEAVITFLKKNTHQSLNTTELVQRIKEHVAAKAKQSPVEGRVQNSDDENGEFIFHLKVSEADFWSKVQEEDSIRSYQNYLDYYPSGRFATQAERRLDALKEDGFWENAKAKDNELAYENYLKKYAGTGKYLEEARQRLQALSSSQEERRKMLEEMAQKDAEREDIHQQFLDRINEAESLFQKRELEAARSHYRDSLQYYMSGFVPAYEYIEQQINFCTNGLAFLQHYELGKQAMDQGNFRLALQYFKEAQKTGDDPKVEDYISICRQQLQRPARPAPASEPAAPPPQRRPQVQVQARGGSSAVAAAPPTKKKSSALPWILGIIGFIVVGTFIALAVAGLAESEPDYGYSEYESPAGESGEPPAEPAITQGSSTPPETRNTYSAPPPTNAELILGEWGVTDITSNGVSIRQMGVEYQQMLDMLDYTFYFDEEGTVEISTSMNMSEYHNYYVNGNAISMQSFTFSGNGVINQLDDSRMQLTFYVNDYYGNSMPMTLHFRR